MCRYGAKHSDDLERHLRGGLGIKALANGQKRFASKLQSETSPTSGAGMSMAGALRVSDSAIPGLFHSTNVANISIFSGGRE